ncbi:septum site-determining protein MinC [Candidatus Pantoea edessiphila]|uniref:Probable septum site-determining protein MinC n=1 Tax=Candidatus Pantoea edessiphila TaxID=2044610 RepID=A0A2P5SYN5_9GAMM|nr:septum site-determining protein MinC [Candidatus Pantoea edessiphila]MBK4775426.1 septum site-determining protein MinC [Pantoea sp. Edef]PPI87444.1 septum site-determining protein MinC [Candidatus Pantoea edessiphila]
MSQPIKFKGSNFRFSVIYLYNHEPDVICKAIKNKLKQLPVFTRHLPIVLNIEGLNHEVDWEHMKQALLATGLCIIGISGCKEISLIKKIDNIGLPILTEMRKSYARYDNNEHSISKLGSVCIDELVYNKTRVINLPVRSGQQIYARNADLVIVGNVSTGAELISDGNIHIYGIMRGRALAGANGDHNCYIFCSNLDAELVSIAGKYWVMDQIPKIFSYKSTRICLKKGMLNIQELN